MSTLSKWVVVDYGDGYTEAQRYATLLGWEGSNCWRRSSPVMKWSVDGDSLEVFTESGNKYILHKNAMGVTMMTQRLISDAGLTVVSKWEDVCKLLKSKGM